jgi:hypothetical protein
MPLSPDLREFVECLNSNRVDYLIVGNKDRIDADELRRLSPG